MDYLIVAYRSRQSTLKYYELLTKNRIACEIVSTPKEAGVGCGLSVKISKKYFEIAKRAVISSGLPNFAGFFQVKTVGGRRFIKTI